MRWIRTLVRWATAVPPLVVDLVVAVAITGITMKIALDSYPASGPRRFDAFAVALTVLANGPLVFRRRAPLTVLLVCTAAIVTYEACGFWLGANQLGPQAAYFTVATKRGRAWTVAAALLIFPEIVYSNVHTWTGSVVDVVVMSAVWLVALGVVGDGSRRLVEHNSLVVAHAAQVQREQREREERAVLVERIRIARELHDVVAHHMSVIAVQTGLARYVFESDPATAQHALRAVSEMTSEGLEEVRRLVTVLRPDQDGDGDAAREDQQTPGIEQIAAMVERVALTGVPVDFAVSGPQRPLPAGAALCVYRVVQESLTNAIRYADGASVSVRLQYSPQQISVRITDEGHCDARRGRPVVGDGSGKGLLGMRERAALYGGTLAAGERPEGGFEVVLTLPIRERYATGSASG